MILGLTVLAIPDDAALLRQFEAGDIDALEALLPTLPASSAAGEWLGSLFEADPTLARKGYERLLMDHPGSAFTPATLARLVDCCHAQGDSAGEARYSRLLSATSPRQSVEPTSESIIGPQPEQLSTSASSKSWSVQVGAFRTRKSAEATGRRVSRFGPVAYVEKDLDQGRVIAVQVGVFPAKPDAQALAGEIAASTGINTVVVSAGK